MYQGTLSTAPIVLCSGKRSLETLPMALKSFSTNSLRLVNRNGLFAACALQVMLLLLLLMMMVVVVVVVVSYFEGCACRDW